MSYTDHYITTICALDGSIMSCVPPVVSVTKLVTNPPASAPPPSDPVAIMLDAANGKVRCVLCFIIF